MDLNSKRGILITCDVPMKQFILHLNDKSQFVIDDLDETHLLVEETSVDMIQREIATLMEKNVYTPAIERGQG
ncbi:unnamed protein product [Heterosigma akashiwo]